MISDDDIDVIVAALIDNEELVSAMLDEPDVWEANYKDIIDAQLGDEALQLDEEDYTEIKESVEDVVAADAMADDDAWQDEELLDEVDKIADENATGFDQHTKNVMHAAQEVAKALASGDEGKASVKVQENDDDSSPDRVVIEDVSAEDGDDLLENNDEAGDMSNDAKNSTNSIAKHLANYRW